MTILHMVVKDEADRYLQSCLKWNTQFADRMFVWDDNSDDVSLTLAAECGATVCGTFASSPRFLEAEGELRQLAWQRMVREFDPEPGEWILTLDADEFLTGDLKAAFARADEFGYHSLRIDIPEIFLLTPPSRRVDGYWDSIDGVRATQFEPGDQTFMHPGAASGTLPRYAYRAWHAAGVKILHCGYATAADRLAKYNRYKTAMGGHASNHVESIMGNAKLVLCEGDTPPIWRGRR